MLSLFKENGARKAIIPVAILAGVVSLTLLILHHVSWRSAMEGYGPALENTSAARTGLYLGHLLLTDYIKGDNSADKGFIRENFTNATGQIDRCFAKTDGGGDNCLLGHVEITAQMTKLRDSLGKLTEAVDACLTNASDATAERNYELLYVQTKISMDDTVVELHRVYSESIRRVNRMFFFEVFCWALILCSIIFLLYLMEKNRKKVEGELEKSVRNLEKAQQIAHIGYWELDLTKREVTWPASTSRIIGVEPQSASSDYEGIFKYIHPDDAELVRQAVETAIASGNPFDIEHRIVRPDGAARVIKSHGQLIAGDGGAPKRMIGVIHDITELRNAEDQITLAGNVFRRAIEGIVVTDTKGVILDVNPAVTQITGYDRDELIGANPRVLRSDRHGPEFYKKMWDTLLAIGEWQGEIWNRRKSGEAYPEWLSITAIKNAEGKVTKYVSVFHDLTQMKRSEEALRYQADHDALTNLPNRFLLEDRLQQGIAAAHRSKGMLAVLFIGLDRFKNINESLGHASGDYLLQHVANRLDELRREGDTVARFSGDEFVMILTNIGNEQESVKMALDILELFSEPFGLVGKSVYVTASVGVALYPNDRMEAQTLIASADLAMRWAKDEGRNSYHMYTPSLNKITYERLSLENDLRKALEREEFRVYYQPKLCLLTGEIVGMEALARWQSATRGLVSPGAFIPLAEETGLIIPLGEWMLRQSCKHLKEWRDKGYTDLRVAVNLSAVQFKKADLMETVEDILRETGLSPEYLEIELTESTVMKDVDEAIAKLNTLSEMGVTLAVDDFGTGYSSLNYLKRFPLNSLKIDRSFVSDLVTDSDDAAIVTTIISMAHSLGLKVVAEGVETEGQLAFLHRQKCDEMQGFLFSKPIPEREFEKMLKEGKKLDIESIMERHPDPAPH